MNFHRKYFLTVSRATADNYLFWFSIENSQMLNGNASKALDDTGSLY